MPKYRSHNKLAVAIGLSFASLFLGARLPSQDPGTTSRPVVAESYLSVPRIRCIDHETHNAIQAAELVFMAPGGGIHRIDAIRFWHNLSIGDLADIHPELTEWPTTIHATAPGYVPQCISIPSTMPSRATSQNWAVDVDMRHGATLAGRVCDISGKAVAGAEVVVARPSGEPMFDGAQACDVMPCVTFCERPGSIVFRPRRTFGSCLLRSITSDTGAWSITGVPSGVCRLIVNPNANVHDSLVSTLTNEMTVGNTDPNSQLLVSLDSGRLVSGVCETRCEFPVDSWKLIAKTVMRGIAWEVQAPIEANSTFTFPALPDAEYDLELIMTPVGSTMGIPRSVVPSRLTVGKELTLPIKARMQ